MQELELVRHYASGLLMVRIDHIDPALHMKTKAKKMTSLVIDSQTSFSPIAFPVARDVAPQPQRMLRMETTPRSYFSKEQLWHQNLIVSYGLVNFEESSFAEANCRDAQQYLQLYHLKRHWNATKVGFMTQNSGNYGPRASKVFLRCYPTLCEDRNVILIDASACRKYLGQDEEQCCHSGLLPKIIEDLLNGEKEFSQSVYPISEFQEDEKNLIIVVDWSGKHRSVAKAHILKYGVCDSCRKKTATIHLNEEE